MNNSVINELLKLSRTQQAKMVFVSFSDVTFEIKSL